MLSLNKVLIIEDNQLNLDMAKDLLNCEGFQTFEAEEGETGVKLAKELRPNLILLDLNLPNKNGYEVLEELRADPSTRDILVLAFTALAMEEDKNRANASGFNGIITKPINVDNFAQVVQSYIMEKKTPLADEFPQSAPPKADTPSKPNDTLIPARPYEILVVDDSSANVGLLQEIILPMGHQVTTAYSGAEALDAVGRHKPDLILLDIMMPDMDGYEVLEALQQNPETRDIIVVFVSALNEAKDITKGLSKGAYDYLTKPLKPEEIQARISATLRTKGLQDELRQKVAETESAKQDLEQFLFIASHDLQAPLRKIQQFSEFLSKPPTAEPKPEITDPKNTDYVAGIHRNCKIMEALLAGLLTLSRIDRKGALFAPVKLEEVVTRILNNRQEALRYCDLQLSLPSTLTVFGDSDQLTQALDILLDNALKFHRENTQPVLRITTQAVNPNCAEITIQDNGIGFEQKYAERIFKPLERLNGASKYPGAGMGLAILKKIVNRHQGSIEVKSQPGEGSQFTLHLPLI